MQQILLFGIMQQSDTEQRNADDIQEMNQYASTQNKSDRMFPFSRKRNDESGKKNNHTQRIAAFNNSCNINMVEIYAHPRLIGVNREAAFVIEQQQ